MAIETGIDESTVAELKEHLRGSLIQPGDREYDAARRVWNGMIDRKPALIARCAGVADVIAAVNFAREHRLLISVRGGGHSVPGHSVADGALMIDLSGMRSVRVDPARRTARAEGGALWRDLDHETQAFGLAVTGGQVSHTGIGGLTLGGGWGYLTRKCGFTVDNLLSVDIVTADGRLLKVGAEENPDLFWGLRGGGGNFGVVTSFEYRLHPVGPIVTGGMALYALDQAPRLLRLFRDVVSQGPDELTVQLLFVTAPSEPFVPEAFRGKKVLALALCHCGTPEQVEGDLEELHSVAPIFSTIGRVPYVKLQQMTDDINAVGSQYYTKGMYVRALNDEAIDAILRHGPTAPSPFTLVALISLGGAARRVPEGGTAMSGRDALCSFDIITQWLDPAEADKNIEWTRSVASALRPHSTGHAYVNLIGDDGADAVQLAYPPEIYARLVGLKNRYDPTNLFRLNQNVKPTA